MAHGTTGTRDFGLPSYAARFAGAGLAVLAFDYRHFGASDGEPRQLIDVDRQLEDLGAAVSFARALPDYSGEAFEQMVADEVAFLTEHVRPRSTAES